MSGVELIEWRSQQAASFWVALERYGALLYGEALPSKPNQRQAIRRLRAPSKQEDEHAENARTSASAGYAVQLSLARGGGAPAQTTGQRRSPARCFCASVSGLTSILDPLNVNVFQAYQSFHHWIIAAIPSLYGDTVPERERAALARA